MDVGKVLRDSQKILKGDGHPIDLDLRSSLAEDTADNNFAIVLRDFERHQNRIQISIFHGKNPTD